MPSMNNVIVDENGMDPKTGFFNMIRRPIKTQDDKDLNAILERAGLVISITALKAGGVQWDSLKYVMQNAEPTWSDSDCDKFGNDIKGDIQLNYIKTGKI